MPTGTAISMAMSEVTSGAVDRRQRAELLGDRVPRSVMRKPKPKSRSAGQRADDQRQEHAAEQHQHGDRRGARQAAEDRVAAAAAAAGLRGARSIVRRRRRPRRSQCDCRTL